MLFAIYIFDVVALFRIQFYNIISHIISSIIKQMRSKSQSRIKKLQEIGFKHEVQKLRKDYINSNRFREIKHTEKAKSLKNISKSQLSANSGKFLDPTKIISVSAHKWAIFDYYSSKYIRGYRAHDLNELSAFSKLLVFCTINALVIKHKIDTARFQTIVTPTVLKYYKNCKLKVDDIVTLQNLIHLLLMEDKEQYQLIAAINIGAYLQKKRNKQYYSVYDADEKMYKIHMNEFYDLVNSYCQTMNMENIKYIEADPAKRKQLNKCSAFDIAVLSSECLKIPLFREILKLPSKSVEIKYINNEGMLEIRNIELKNKTVANPYISYFNVCRNWGENQFMNSHASLLYQQSQIQPIVVVLLGSYGPHDLEKDIQQIIQWYIKTQVKKDTTIKSQQKLQVRTQAPEEIQKQLSIHKKSHDRLKTQMSKQLESILQQKLKGRGQPSFKIKDVKKNIVKLKEIPN